MGPFGDDDDENDEATQEETQETTQKTVTNPFDDLPHDISGEEDFYSLPSSPTLPRSKTLYKNIMKMLEYFKKTKNL